MCQTGNVTPDLWRQEAVGMPISYVPILLDVREALRGMEI